MKVTDLQIETGATLGPDVSRLLDDWPHRPYSGCPGTAPQGQTAYLYQSLRQAELRGAATYLAHEGLEIRGLLQWEELGWDSEILGFPVARISNWIGAGEESCQAAAREKLLQAALEDAHRQNIRYLLARVPAGDHAGISALERDGFTMVDALLTFGGEVAGLLSAASVEQNGLPCRPFEPSDLPELEEIARLSFASDRFHADPAIGKKKADEVHRRWIVDSCAGPAEGVLVACTDSPLGFTTLRRDPLSQETLGVQIGIIVLVATAAPFRGIGVGRRLTQAALRWFLAHGCHWVEVGTQLANTSASRLYEATGLKLVRSSITFRRLL